MYYDTEQPLPADDFERLARRVMASTDEEKEALTFVLGEFFERTGNVYTHDFCDEVIETYHAFKANKSRAGKASAEARRKKSEERKTKRRMASEGERTGVQQVLDSVATEPQQTPTNHKPITNNQEPLTNKDFEKFYAKYPNKVKKERALKAWLKHNPDINVVLKALEYQTSNDRRFREKEFTPHPASWLNDKEWENEPVKRKGNSTYL